MSFFNRLSEIVTSNVNALLEKADNPEATVKQLREEMEKGVEAAKRSAASALASARRLKRELDDYREKVGFWDQKARAAIELGRDDLARRCLQRRRELNDLAGALEQQYDSAAGMVENLMTTLRALEARLAETIRRETSYSEGFDAEKEEAAPPEAEAAPSDPERRARVSQLEREILAAEREAIADAAAAEAESQLESARRELEEHRDLEAELAALKKEVGTPS